MLIADLLSSGDYYITKHSNLAEVHVVFHLVVDDSIRQSTMNSRHRCLSGLRSLLHTASRCDIKTLTIPLLFVYEMSEVSALCPSSVSRILNVQLDFKLFCYCGSTVMHILNTHFWAVQH